MLEQYYMDFILVGSDVDADEKYWNNGLLLTTNSKDIMRRIRHVFIANKKLKFVFITKINI